MFVFDDGSVFKILLFCREKRPKKRLVYTGKPQTKKKKKKKDLSKLEESLRDEMDKDVSNSMEAPDGKKHSDQPTTPDHHEEGDEVEGEKSVRKSTRTAVVVRQAEREAIRAALQATTKVSLSPRSSVFPDSIYDLVNHLPSEVWDIE